MNPKAFVVVLACVMVAGVTLGESGKGHLRPKSVTATCFVSSAQISWEAVIDENLTGYDVYKKADGESYYVKANLELVTLTEYLVLGLSGGTSYNFAVTAVYDDGLSSELSDPASCMTG